MKRIAFVSLSVLALAACGQNHGTTSTVNSAQSLDTFPTDALGVTTIPGELVSVTATSPRCPQGAICEPTSELKFKFTLEQCGDTFGGMQYTTQYDRTTGKNVIYVSGLNIRTERSSRIRCITAATATRSIYKMGIFSQSDFEVRSFGTVPAAAFPSDARGLSMIDGSLGEVTTSAPRCPVGAICEPVTEVKINFPLTGCLDQLGPMVYEVNFTSDGKTELLVGGTSIHTKGSMTIQCFAAPVAQATIAIHGILTSENFVVKPLATQK